MNSEDKELIIDLEFALCAKLRPIFLAISDPDEDDGSIEIVIGCLQFANKSVQERIGIIFKLINEYVPGILENRLVVVQAYSNSEIDNILDDLFSQELF